MACILYCASSSDKKEFDAFISYGKWSSLESEATSSLSEENLALSLFPEVLENKYGYTLCLLERDVAPGGGKSCTPTENVAQEGELRASTLYIVLSFFLLGYLSSGRFHELRTSGATTQKNVCFRDTLHHQKNPSSMDICVCLTDSLCYKAETNTAL